MHSVVAGGPGFVAVGGSDIWFGNDAANDAAVWTSVDGLTWSRVPHDEGVFSAPGWAILLMRSVVVGGPGLVAVGSVEVRGERDAAVWTSVDGLVWSRVPHDEAVFGGPDSQTMFEVVAGGPGLVAVGQDGTMDDYAGAVWTSLDGLTWSRVPRNATAFGSGSSMSSVVVWGEGLVAVGTDRPADGHAAAVWTSPDGLVWSRVPHDEAVFGGPGDQWMRSVVVGGPGLVAVGVDASGGGVGEWDAAVWTSVDGLTWSRVPHDEAVFGGPDTQAMTAVASGGPGLVAVGREGEHSLYVAAVWVSSDGLVWSRVRHDEAVFGGENDEHLMYSVVAAGPGWIAVGSSGLAGGEVAAVWVSPPQP